MSKLEFREKVALAKTSFEKTKSITYERYKLFTKTQEAGESLESFHAALTAQAAKGELGTLEDELVRDLIISKVKNIVLQNTLTFETFTPDEVLKQALKFEHSKQTRQPFQKSYATTASAGILLCLQVKIKLAPIMEVGNKGGNNRRPNKEPYKRRKWDTKNNTKWLAVQKPCTRSGKPFVETHLRNCPALGKTCKNCNKPNHFARMCRSQQANEVAEEISSSDEECNLMRCFDSCDDFEIMVIEKDEISVEQIKYYISERLNKRTDQSTERKYSQNVRKIDIRRDPRSAQIKSLKTLVRIDNQIINLTIDTGSPVSFLNWATTKQTPKSVQKRNSCRRND